MPEVENKPKNWVKNRSPQGHFEGQEKEYSFNHSVASSIKYLPTDWYISQKNWSTLLGVCCKSKFNLTENLIFKLFNLKFKWQRNISIKWIAMLPL